MFRDLHSLPAAASRWSDADKAIDEKWKSNIHRTFRIISAFGEKHLEFKPHYPNYKAYKVSENQNYCFYVFENPVLRPNGENYGAAVIIVPRMESDVLFEKNVYDYNIYSSQLYWGYTEIHRNDGSISCIDKNVNINVRPCSVLEKAILIALAIQSWT